MANIMKNAAASESIAKMYLNERLADVHFEFKVDDETETVPANKSVLAALSPVFDTMFFGLLKEGSKVRIEDANADAFKEFLQFFYLGEVAITMENIETVVRLADKYDVLEKFNACAVLMQNQLKLDNMCWGYQLAVNLKNEQLIDFCADEISKSPKDVFSSDAFKRCDKSTLERILELDLNCPETDVFDACLAWAKYACGEDGLDATQSVNLRTHLGDCLKLIRFGAMTSDEFSKRYMLHKALFTSEEFEDIMLTLSVAEYEPKIFNPNSRHTSDNEHSDNKRVKLNGCDEYVGDDDSFQHDLLKCQRKTKENPRRYINIHEVTSFSSNNDLFLNEIVTAKIIGSSKVIGTMVKVTVVEHKFQRFGEKPKILYYGTFNTWFNGTLNVNLPTPILIKQHKLYEIWLGLRFTDGCHYYSNCKQSAELKDGTRIQFYRNPYLDYNNLANGWISTLFFEN